jgi:FkbM family methyltransferase
MERCLNSAGVKVRGVLHVGGHLGEEYPLYKQIGATKIVFFEPMPHVFKELKSRFKRHPDVVLMQQALGSKRETKEMFVNRGAGESSSFLTPSSLYDGFFLDRKVPLRVDTLDSIIDGIPERELYNLLVTDTQGFDLEVLKGAQRTLAQIDYVYTEVSKGHYVGEPTIAEMDAYLDECGFMRGASSIYGKWKENDQWGDLFYVKKTNTAFEVPQL